MIARTLLLVLLLAAFAAADDRELADEAWSAGRFADAAVLYSRALKAEGADVASIRFRLGCCAYRRQRWAEAVHHFRCAALRSPRDERIAFNLGLAARRLDKPRPSTARDGIEGRWNALTPRERLMLAVFLQLTGLLGAFASGRTPTVRAIGLLVLLVGIAIQARVIRDAWTDDRPGIVLAETLDVRSDPHRSATPLFELEAGEEIVVREASDRWALVSSIRGEGWVERSAVGVVE